jgi:S1-C subfamily serine protease
MKLPRSIFIQTIVISTLTSSLFLGAGYYLLVSHKASAPNDEQTQVRPLVSQSPGDTVIPDVVETAIPAVVSITISADVPVIEQYYDNFWSPFGSGFGFQVPRQRQIGTQRQEIGGGTGFFVSADGYLVTNKHVVDQEGVEYSVVTNDGKTYDVQVVAKDPSLDVAILKVEADADFPFLTFADMEQLRLGESVIAIGNALAEFPNSVSVGVVSGLSRDIVASDGFSLRESLEGVIQTDAAINRGNSGGPLINTHGEVIGVNVAVAGSGENIGFALPSNVVRSVFESVVEHGEIVRPFLGVRHLQITPEIAEQNRLDVDHGVLIVRGPDRGDLAVIPGSPADKAGLVENDIVLAIDGIKLDGSQSLSSLLRTYDVGDTITLQVLQDGESKEMIVELDAF